MGFDPDAADALLAVADPDTRPIVGALCVGVRKEEMDGRGGFRSVPFPTIYDFRPLESGDPGFVPRYDYTPNSVVQCSATGAAFLLIHRSAFTRISADGWFDRAKLTAESETMG